MSRTQSFTSTDKEKNPPTPRSKIGHRRVDETGETTYKKVCVKKLPSLYLVFSEPICTFPFGNYYLFFLSFVVFVFFSTCTFPIKLKLNIHVYRWKWILKLLNTVKPPVSDHPKCQAVDDRLWEMVAHKSLDHFGSKFVSLAHRIWRLNRDKMFYSCKKSTSRKMWYLPFRNFCLLYYPGMR